MMSTANRECPCFDRCFVSSQCPSTGRIPTVIPICVKVEGRHVRLLDYMNYKWITTLVSRVIHMALLSRWINLRQMKCIFMDRESPLWKSGDEWLDLSLIYWALKCSLFPIGKPIVYVFVPLWYFISCTRDLWLVGATGKKQRMKWK